MKHIFKYLVQIETEKLDVPNDINSSRDFIGGRIQQALTDAFYNKINISVINEET